MNEPDAERASGSPPFLAPAPPPFRAPAPPPFLAPAPPPFRAADDRATDDLRVLRAAGGACLAAVLAVLGWVWVWPATGDDLISDAVRGAFVGGLGGLVGWLAADRGRWHGRGAVVISLCAALPAAAAMSLLTRRVDPALSASPEPVWSIAPLLVAFIAGRTAWGRATTEERVPADAWLAGVVVVAVVVASSLGILNTIGRPLTAAEQLCERFDDWAAARDGTVGGDAEQLARQEFFSMALGVAPTPVMIEQSNRMLEMSYRIDEKMSPAGDAAQLMESERALRSEMERWKGRAC